MTNLCHQPYCQSLDLLIKGGVLVVVCLACGIFMWGEKR